MIQSGSLQPGVIAAFAAALLAQPCAAQQDQQPTHSEPPQTSTVADQWRVELTPYAWAFDLDGKVGVRGQTALVNVTFREILEDADSILAFAGRLDLRNRRWGGFIDAGFASVTVEGATGPLGISDVDVEYEQTIVDFGVSFCIGEWAGSSGPARNTTLDVYAGGRYSNIDLTISPALLPQRSGSESWVDPIIGLKLNAPLSEQWRVAVSADIGGFGIASDLTWSASLVVGYDFHISGHYASVYAGYRAIGWDYANGPSASEFIWDVVEHGICFGFTYRF